MPEAIKNKDGKNLARNNKTIKFADNILNRIAGNRQLNAWAYTDNQGSCINTGRWKSYSTERRLIQ